jgi:hypothetical protein
MKLGATLAELVDLAELATAPTSVGPAAVMLPLAERNRPRVRVMREGALDYQTIPSRMGDVLVPHKVKAAA